MITPKLVSIRTKSGDDITPAEMMRDHLGLSQRQRVEAMAERRRATDSCKEASNAFFADADKGITPEEIFMAGFNCGYKEHEREVIR